jgi:hypothetical protein
MSTSVSDWGCGFHGEILRTAAGPRKIKKSGRTGFF